MYNSRQTCQVLKEEALFIPSWDTSGRTRHFICILKTEEDFSLQNSGERVETLQTQRTAQQRQESGDRGGFLGQQGGWLVGRELERAGKRRRGEAQPASDSPPCYMHMHTRTHAHTHMLSHIHACTRTHTNTCKHTRALTHVHPCTHTHVLSHTFTHACSHTCTHASTQHSHMLSHGHSHMCTFSDMHTHTHTHMHTHIHTHALT